MALEVAPGDSNTNIGTPRAAAWPPAVGPAVWRAANVEADPVHQLTPQQVRELVEVGRSVPHDVAALAHANLRERIPALAATMEQVHTALASGRGVALLRGFPVDQLDVDGCCVAYWALGTHLGTGVSQSSAGELVGQVRDRGTARLKTRGYQSNARLTFHVDLADIVGLLCVRTAQSGGQSLTASSLAVYNAMRTQHPEYLEALAAGFHWSRNGEHVAGQAPYSNPIPLFSVVDGVVSCRMNLSMIRLGAKDSGVALTPLQEQALECIQETAARADLCWSTYLEPGDILFLNNYTTLHSRTEFTDWPDPQRSRLMLRLWLRDEHLRSLGPQARTIRDEPLMYGLQGRTPLQLIAPTARSNKNLPETP